MKAPNLVKQFYKFLHIALALAMQTQGLPPKDGHKKVSLLVSAIVRDYHNAEERHGETIPLLFNSVHGMHAHYLPSRRHPISFCHPACCRPARHRHPVFSHRDPCHNLPQLLPLCEAHAKTHLFCRILPAAGLPVALVLQCALWDRLFGSAWPMNAARQTR